MNVAVQPAMSQLLNPDPRPADVEVRRVDISIERGTPIATYQFKAATSAGQDWIEDELGLRCKAQNNCWQMTVIGELARTRLQERMQADGVRVSFLSKF